MLVYCGSGVADVGPTLKQYKTRVSYFLEYMFKQITFKFTNKYTTKKNRICVIGKGAHSKQTQNISITFVQRRPNVFDVGPALYKCYRNVLCLLGWISEFLQ